MANETFSYRGTRLAQEVKDQFGDTSGAQITDGMLLTWINNGIREIAVAHPYLETSATTNILAGINVYNMRMVFPANRIQTFSMVLANGRPLTHHSIADYKRMIEKVSEVENKGAPTDYTVFGGSLTLWPTPTETVTKGLTLYFYQMPEDVTTLDDILTSPDRYYNALKEFVLGQAKVLNDDLDGAALAFQRHEQSVQRQFAQQTESPNAYYPTIGADPDDEDGAFF
jgi:hypothetical protein